MSSRQSLGGSRVVYMVVNLNRTPTYGRMQRLCEASETVSLWTAAFEIQSRPPVKLIFPWQRPELRTERDGWKAGRLTALLHRETLSGRFWEAACHCVYIVSRREWSGCLIQSGVVYVRTPDSWSQTCMKRLFSWIHTPTPPGVCMAAPSIRGGIFI